jgi:hypothetical protein
MFRRLAIVCGLWEEASGVLGMHFQARPQFQAALTCYRRGLNP